MVAIDASQPLVDAGTIPSLPDLNKSYTNKFISGC
jgi:hypothetical protein